MSKKSVASNVVILTLMILAVTANAVTIPPIDFPVTVTNGNGTYNSRYVPIPCSEVKVTGWIESPENGNWTIRVWVYKTPLWGTTQKILVFNQSGIVANEPIPEISIPFKLYPPSMAKVHAEVSWSEIADTTLVVRAGGSC